MQVNAPEKSEKKERRDRAACRAGDSRRRRGQRWRMGLRRRGALGFETRVLSAVCAYARN